MLLTPGPTAVPEFVRTAMSGTHLNINLSWVFTLKDIRNNTKFDKIKYQYSARYMTKKRNRRGMPSK